MLGFVQCRKMKPAALWTPETPFGVENILPSTPSANLGISTPTFEEDQPRNQQIFLPPKTLAAA